MKTKVSYLHGTSGIISKIYIGLSVLKDVKVVSA